MKDDKIHPAAELLPMMPEAELRQLADSIKRDGQREPIEMLGDAVIDGRNRLAACRLVAVIPEFRNIVPVDDPIAYVMDKNVNRRHLTTSQRAMVGVKAKQLYAEQARERQRELAGRRPNAGGGDLVENLPQGECGKSRDKAAETVGVSGRSVDFAETVVMHGSQSLQDMVSRGDVSVSAAALVAKQHSQDEQTAIVAAGPDAVKKGAASLRLQQKGPAVNLFDDPIPEPPTPTEAETAREEKPAREAEPTKPKSILDVIGVTGPERGHPTHSLQVHGSDADEAARTLVDCLGVEYAYAVGLQLVAIGEAS